MDEDGITTSKYEMTVHGHASIDPKINHASVGHSDLGVLGKIKVCLGSTVEQYYGRSYQKRPKRPDIEQRCPWKSVNRPKKTGLISAIVPNNHDSVLGHIASIDISSRYQQNADRYCRTKTIKKDQT